jgi:hypothetical protein
MGAKHVGSRLGVESLENRDCPTCSVAVVGGTPYDPVPRLYVTGDNTANTVTIRENRTANVLEVVCDGVTHSFTGIKSMPALISVDLKGGNDTFRYQLAGGSDFTQGKAIRVWLGAGDSNAAQLFLDDNGAGGAAAVKAPLNLTVYGDGQQQYSGVTRDIVDVRLGTVQSAKVSAEARLFGGEDKFTAALEGDLQGTAQVYVNAIGGAEGDDLKVTADADVDVGPDARLDVSLHGSYPNYWHTDFEATDRDVLSVGYQGEVDGTLRVQAEGGAADDEVSATLVLDAGGTGFLDGIVSGGSGDDTLGFQLQDGSGGGVIYLNALMDGGSGTDTAIWWSTWNITRQNVEGSSPLPNFFPF